jgi:hypothetical protein
MNDRCTALGLGSEAGFVEEDLTFRDKQGSDNMLAGNENGDDRPSNAEKALAQSEYRSTVTVTDKLQKTRVKRVVSVPPGLRRNVFDFHRFRLRYAL